MWKIPKFLKIQEYEKNVLIIFRNRKNPTAPGGTSRVLTILTDGVRIFFDGILWRSYPSYQESKGEVV